MSELWQELNAPAPSEQSCAQRLRHEVYLSDLTASNCGTQRGALGATEQRLTDCSCNGSEDENGLEW